MTNKSAGIYSVVSKTNNNVKPKNADFWKAFDRSFKYN